MRYNVLGVQFFLLFVCFLALITIAGPAAAASPERAGLSEVLEPTDPALAVADPLAASRQLVQVEAANWDATTAVLRRFERAPGGAWNEVGSEVRVNIGRTGLAWSQGFTLSPKPVGPVKREGDGKAPAGLFRLTAVFAYDPAEVVPTAMPVLHARRDLLCIDDAKSKYYNRIVRADANLAKDWDSAEDMLRRDEQYRVGVVVDHNHNGALSEGGSCIFLHIWAAPDKPTAGCTSMAADAMLSLARWLDPAAQPLLLQMSTQGLATFSERWGLAPR